ncbi:MAG: BolA family protein [Myxococcota bacterium]
MADMSEAIKERIVTAIEGATVTVTAAGGGHYALEVTAGVFDGKSTLQRHRLVLGALKELMAGDAAPVHAIDSIKTSVG